MTAEIERRLEAAGVRVLPLVWLASGVALHHDNDGRADHHGHRGDHMTPTRITLSRAKGWRIIPLSWLGTDEAIRRGFGDLLHPDIVARYHKRMAME